PQDGVSMRRLSKQGVRISNKKPRKASGTSSMLYGRFVKSAMLTARGEESTKPPADSESSEEEEKLDLSSARRLTDEELMRVCGGRTAHKGARHGLTMSAKLARLEEQERAFLATYRPKERQPEAPESSPPAERKEKRKKKKKKQEENTDKEEAAETEKKKKKQEEEENKDKEEAAETEKKKKKKKKDKELAETEVPLEDTNGPDQAGHSPKKKRKKRRREAE
ncbi:PREDICTED: G patch domain-containing protein 4, partial [Pterocles gutturalis]|uniref:G patch domain-containing protein 4 n=1 Tax=Pterocles gutturalis TaxID=240206 RepID=UPI000528B903